MQHDFSHYMVHKLYICCCIKHHWDAQQLRAHASVNLFTRHQQRIICLAGTSAPAVPPGMVREVIPSAFVPAIEAAIAEFISKWQDRPAPRLGGGIDAAGAHDDELLRDELRPLVFEEVRLQVRQVVCPRSV
jgi:capsid protein